MALFLCVEIDQECIKDFGNDVLVLEDDNHKCRGHLEQAEKDEKEDPSFKDGNGHEVVEEANGDISDTSGNNSDDEE